MERESDSLIIQPEVVKVMDPRSVSELSGVLFLSRGNVDEPKVVGIGPKKELVCGNVCQMPIEELLVGCVNNALKVFYQGVVAFFVKGLTEFEEIKQMSQHYWGFAPAVYSGVLGDVMNRRVRIIPVKLPESVGFEVRSGALAPLFFS